MNATDRTATGQARGALAGFLLGFALGGFFDGILLHQILQWHHLLSGVDAEAVRDLRVQILADGLFHLLMYAVALAGLFALWRARRGGTVIGSGGLLSWALIGFGAWHVADAVLSHWLLGIHRIRMDSEVPLLWDLAWLVAFGLVPLAIGLWLRGRADDDHGGNGNGPSRTSRGPAHAATGLVLAVLIAGPVAALPPPDSRQVAVLVSPAQIDSLLDGVEAIRGGITWADPGGSLWVFTLPEGADASQLYGHGALFVTRSAAALGCLAWTREARPLRS
jgi:uncharacterized membrane protein